MNCLYEVTPANFSAILPLSLLLYSAVSTFFETVSLLHIWENTVFSSWVLIIL